MISQLVTLGALSIAVGVICFIGYIITLLKKKQSRSMLITSVIGFLLGISSLLIAHDMSSSV